MIIRSFVEAKVAAFKKEQTIVTYFPKRINVIPNVFAGIVFFASRNRVKQDRRRSEESP